LNDYQKALHDLDKANVLEPNNACILIVQSYTQWHINIYQLALENLDNVDVLQHQNEYIVLWDNRKWLKWMLDEYQPII
jgi:hypothetical protein